MSTIAVILDDLFEDSEYVEPVQALKAAGHEVTVFGMEKAKKVKGKTEGTVVYTDRSLDGASAEDFDALLIPGGYSPDRLRAHPEAVEFVKEFMDNDKHVFSICHGVQLLISAKALEGRKVTGWKSLVEDIKYAGAEYVDEEVVKDRNLISSRQPSDIPAFNKACLDVLSSERVAQV